MKAIDKFKWVVNVNTWELTDENQSILNIG